MTKKHIEFSGIFIDINPDLILVKMSGDLKCEKCLEKFKKFADDLDKEIERNFKNTGTRVNLLMDVSKLTDYNTDAFDYLEKSASRTKNYDNKTAVIGASYPLELLADAISALTGHKDIKFFQTKAEAMEWFEE